MDHLDAALSHVAPFERDLAHDRLAHLAGDWEGETQTWFDPEREPERSAIRARVFGVLGGRFVRFQYVSAAMGKPHSGEFTIGYHREEKRVEATWIDSLHNGTAMMACTGSIEAQAIVFSGSYPAGTERWGWRTEIAHPEPDRLVVRAFNISPAGASFRALETELRRSSG